MTNEEIKAVKELDAQSKAEIKQLIAIADDPLDLIYHCSRLQKLCVDMMNFEKLHSL